MVTRLALLFHRYMDGSSTPEETYEFFVLADRPENEAELKALMDARMDNPEIIYSLDELQQQQVLQEIFQNHSPEEQKHQQIVRSLRRKILAAASIFIAISVTAYLYSSHFRSPQQLVAPCCTELLPGSNNATLTLSDGTKISMTKATAGMVARQGAVNVRKTTANILVYDSNAAAGNNDKENNNKNRGSYAEGNYNELSTPAGGQYRVNLPDGTRVWLNSSSSLKYPVSLGSTESRSVILTGEAYFEVAKIRSGKHKQPFFVHVQGQEIEVLGTNFNINAYPEEDYIATTLLEGSVKVKHKGDFDRILVPGQQAQVNAGLRVTNVDTTFAVAWKNGLFKFDHAAITTVMNQFSRWYDVEVVYEGTKPKNRFNGEVYRNMNAEKALQLLGHAKINFRIVYPARPGTRKRIIIY